MRNKKGKWFDTFDAWFNIIGGIIILTFIAIIVMLFLAIPWFVGIIETLGDKM